jgi:hypothetical protein
MSSNDFTDESRPARTDELARRIVAFWGVVLGTGDICGDRTE